MDRPGPDCPHIEATLACSPSDMPKSLKIEKQTIATNIFGSKLEVADRFVSVVGSVFSPYPRIAKFS